MALFLAHYFRELFCTLNQNKTVIPFLKKVVQQLNQKHNRFDDLVLVLPSKRSKVFLIDHLLQLNETSQFAPEIYSIEEFIAKLSQLKIASQTQQLFLLYQAYLGLCPKDEIDDFELFMTWGSRLLKDFNDIDAYQIKTDVILANLGAYYAMESSASEEHTTSFSVSFWENLPALYHDFSSLLQTHYLGTIGMLYKDALETLEVYLTSTEKHHYFLGFNALNTSEEYLFQEFLIAGKGTALWDLDHEFYQDKIHAAGRFIQRYQKEWNHYRQFPVSFDERNFSSEKEIKAIGFSGNIGQAKYVGTLLEELASTRGSTAVVLGNETMLIPTLSALPESITEWNVTMGYPIENQPVVQFFIRYFELYIRYNSAEGFLLDLVIDLLAFKPVLWCFKEEDRKAIQRAIYSLKSKNTLRINETDLAVFNCAEISLFTPEIGKEITTFLVHIHQLIDVLSDACKKQKSMTTVFTSLVLLKENVLEMVDELEDLPFSISLGAVLEIFKEGLKKKRIDFKGNPTEGVQIMGMLETRGLDFDHIIITNVNEGVLPVGKNDQSFFPFGIKKHFGLPTFLDNDAIYTYHFYRLLQRAKSIYLLYNAKSEGLNAGEKSRFITQLTHLKHPAHQFSDQLFQQKIPLAIPLENSVDKTKTMINRLKEIAETGFSPTSLSAYLVDPLDFYTKYVLGINPKESLGKTVSNAQRGTIIHQVLENLYTPHLNKVMQPFDYDQMLRQVEDEIQALYQVEYPEEKTPQGENKLILSAYQRAITQYLMLEKEVVAAGNELIILELEKQFKVPIPADIFPHPVMIRGKIDRIDQFNGQLRLIDYKTGSVEKNKLQWKNWDDFFGDYKYQPMFQLLIYSWSMQSEINHQVPVEAGIISLKTPHQGVMKISKKQPAHLEDKYIVGQEFIDDFEQFLWSLLKEIFEEKKSFVSLNVKEI